MVRNVLEVQILSEDERPGGLLFRARVSRDGIERTTAVHLHWADYNLWSPDGALAPERVAHAVIRVFETHCGFENLPASFDAAHLRRRWPEADDRVAELAQRGERRGEIGESR